MRAESKRKNLVLPLTLTICLFVFFLLGGLFFMRYFNSQIFEERTTQLLEITSQVRTNLRTALEISGSFC